jgi:hypothetical protein
MSYTFDIPIDTVFFLFFAGGFIVGFATLYMIMDYARMRAEHAEKYNCMGVRRPTQGRKAPPLPLHPKK